MKIHKGLVLFTVILVMLAFSTTPSLAEKSKSIVLGSGPVGGGFNMVTVGVAKYWKKDLGITTNIVPGAMPANLKKFAAGKLPFAMGAASWAKAMYDGNMLIFGDPAKHARVMFHIYENPWYVIALKSSGLRKISDLKDKRYGGGPNKRIWYHIMGNKMEANGVPYNDNSKMRIANFQDMAIMVGDGTLDACASMLEGFTPQPATQRLMQEKEIVVLEWDPAVIEKFKKDAFYPTLIKKGIVPFITKDFWTFSGGAANIICRNDADDELVYNLVKTMHKNLQTIAGENPFWKYPAQIPEILTIDSGVPYHPGAIKYWKEVGMWKK